MQNFIIYRASAGSGKTFTLVTEYLALCLGNKELAFKADSFRNILAITFTNKATAELENRVLDTLKELSENAEKSNYSKGITERTGLSIDEISERAYAVLQNILHNFSHLGIKTIDKFTTQFVKPFALDLELPPDYEIVLNEEDILEKITNRLLSKAGSDKELSEVLSNWADMQIARQEKPLQLQKQLLSFAKQLYKNENYYLLKLLEDQGSNKEMGATIKELQSKMINLDKTLKEKAEKLEAVIVKVGFENIKNGRNSGASGLITDWKNEIYTSIQSKPRWLSMCSNDEGPIKKEVADSYAAESQQIINISWEIDAFIEENGLERFFIHQIINNLPFLQISGIIKAEFDKYCLENNVVLLSQLSVKIKDLLREQGTDFIYERLGNKIQHILIDEFQDTSVLQWHNLFPIVENVLSDGGKCILVGDAKQAIYRFRGGEVAQIVNLPAIVPNPNPEENLGLEAQFKAQHKPENLEVNYRSGKNIIDFNNQYLDYISNHLDEAFKKFFTEGKQKPKENHNPGFVRIHHSEAEKQDFNEEAINFAVAQTQEAIANGVLAKDIAILVQKTKEVNAIRYALDLANIPSTSVKGIELLDYAPIKLIYHILDLPQHVQKEIKGIKILNALCEVFPEKYQLDHLLDSYYEILSAYSSKLREDELLNLLGYDKKTQQENLSLALEKIMYTLGLDIASSPLQILLNLARSYQQKFGNWHQGFVNHIKEQSKSIILNPDNPNAVVLSTYHASKGLDFHTVILPHLIKSNPNFRDPSWVKTPENFSFSAQFPLCLMNLSKNNSTFPSIKEIYEGEISEEHQDWVNIAYVAQTRAVANMVINSPYSKPPKNGASEKNFFDNLHQFLAKHYPAQKNNYCDLGTWEASDPEEKKSETPVLFLENVYLENYPPAKLLVPTEKDATERGKELHLWFSLYDPSINQEAFVEKVTKMNPELNAQEVARFYDKIDLQFKSFLPAVPNKTLIEREFCFENEILRPDRIDFTANEVIVSDLKTGLQDEGHQKQIITYLRCVENVFNKKTKGYLLYIDIDKTEEIHAY